MNFICIESYFRINTYNFRYNTSDDDLHTYIEKFGLFHVDINRKMLFDISLYLKDDQIDMIFDVYMTKDNIYDHSGKPWRISVGYSAHLLRRLLALDVEGKYATEKMYFMMNRFQSDFTYDTALRYFALKRFGGGINEERRLVIVEILLNHTRKHGSFFDLMFMFLQFDRAQYTGGWEKNIGLLMAKNY